MPLIHISLIPGQHDSGWTCRNIQLLWPFHRQATELAPNYQLSDVHSSSATRSRFGSDPSSCSVSTVAGTGEGPQLCTGTMKCGWTDISCGKEAATLLPAALLSDTTTVVDGSEVTLRCAECSDFICTTDADDTGTFDAMLSISTGITICLQMTPKGSWYLSSDQSKDHQLCSLHS